MSATALRLPLPFREAGALWADGDRLLPNPPLVRALPGEDFAFCEPEGDFAVGALRAVRGVNEIAPDIDAEIATDGARFGVRGVRRAVRLTHRGDRPRPREDGD